MKASNPASPHRFVPASAPRPGTFKEIFVNELVYPRERTLGVITLVLGVLFWLLLIVGTVGIALAMVLVGFILYLFAQSTLIAHIKGNGVELSERQFPELYAQFTDCCERLGMRNRPEVFILNGNGGLNAFATKFLGTEFVVLYSDVVDAMAQHPDGVRFYIGHELGHLRMKHLGGHLVRWPALWLPLIGAAYARAKESTCDRHGLACSSSPEGAARALAALSAGVERWKDLDVATYVRQAEHTSGFWMSFHELTTGYPWLTKRAARVVDTNAAPVARNPFAYVLALFVPYAGRMGAGFGMIMLVYIIGVLAAVALPAYSDYMNKAQLSGAFIETTQARMAVGDYYEKNQAIPPTLEDAGAASFAGNGTRITLDPATMIMSVKTVKNQELVFVPEKDSTGHIVWHCSGGAGMRINLLPPGCRE
jgi:Zn-dependent protease with chaperone function/Tfp pilus assembly major pilin PilA